MASSFSDEQAAPSSEGFFSKFIRSIAQRHQKFLDDITPHVTPRWVVCLLLLLIFMARIILLQGWYIIAYGLGIYMLNLFIAFLTPKIDPALAEVQENADGPSLPTKADAEFKPFIRRLPEFKFWHGITYATVLALFMTCFQMFNIPVFWPVLVIYFITLFVMIMKKQIQHMIRYRYLPFSHGKRRYAGKEDTGKVVTS
ncbi:protein RER1-like [Sycon ciliatum]|uniref:protein RER1-like n=1 Tax=Sycon ciliatum TaxID=27933 RepID=UPI0020A949B1|eukprot:scpid84820/ scgid29228/ Protein RER1